MITFRCACGVQLEVQEEHAGRKVLCPKCQKPQDVPRPDSIVPVAEVLAVPVVKLAEVPDEAERPAPRPRRRRLVAEDRAERRAPRTSASGKAAAGMILGILTFIIPLLLTLPALILSLLGLRDVKRGGGPITGLGIAITAPITRPFANLTL